ncbi:MAG: hypothetical protein WBE18_03775 [Gammaproteobacteria bacterium]
MCRFMLLCCVLVSGMSYAAADSPAPQATSPTTTNNPNQPSQQQRSPRIQYY